MNVLVAYASRLGSTRGIAARLAARLEANGLDAVVQEIRSSSDLVVYDAFVIGSAVYGGHWLKEAKRFVLDRRAALLGWPVWLFSSGPVGRAATRAEPVAPAEIGELRIATLARGHRIFAGALDRQTIDSADLGIAERFIARLFVPEGDFREWAEIDSWADSIARELAAAPAGPR